MTFVLFNFSFFNNYYIIALHFFEKNNLLIFYQHDFFFMLLIFLNVKYYLKHSNTKENIFFENIDIKICIISLYHLV